MVGSRSGLEDGEGEWSSKGGLEDGPLLPSGRQSPSPLEDGEGEWSAVP